MVLKTTPILEQSETFEKPKKFLPSDEQIKQELYRQSFLIWASRQYGNNIKTEKGIELNWETHRFLKDIYEDWAMIQVVRKASQIGFSTMMILKALYAAYYKKFNIIYTLPTYHDISEFVSSKFNSIVRQNPILQGWVKDKDSITQKQVGERFIYNRGTFSNHNDTTAVAAMLSSDLNIHDECDRSDQNILLQYESRQKDSQYKGRWYFSNPTTTSQQNLSNELWERSDQKHWFIHCRACQHWQFLEWPESIRDERFICKKCGGEIDDETRSNGQWIQRYSGREISGYWINHLMCPWITAKEIVADSQKDQAYFYNFVLGLPYKGTGVTIDANLILQNVTDKINTKRHAVMGVDVGLTKHYVVRNEEGIFDVGKVNDWRDIEVLLSNYDVGICVIDALPDLTEPRKLVKKYPGRVWLSFFKSAINKTDFIKWDNNTKTVYSDRSKVIGAVIDELIEGKMKFNITPEEDFTKHFKSVYKKKIIDKMGNEQEIWDTDSPEDHYLFATVYSQIAMMKRGMDRKVTGLKDWAGQNDLARNLIGKENYGLL